MASLDLEGYRLVGVEEVSAALGISENAIYQRKRRGALGDILPPPDIDHKGGSSRIYWKSTTLKKWFESQ